MTVDGALPDTSKPTESEVGSACAASIITVIRNVIALVWGYWFGLSNNRLMRRAQKL